MQPKRPKIELVLVFILFQDQGFQEVDIVEMNLFNKLDNDCFGLCEGPSKTEEMGEYAIVDQCFEFHGGGYGRR